MNKKTITIIIVSILIIVGALRSKNVGTDTPTYVEYLGMLDNYTYNEILDEGDNPDSIYRDPVFYIVAKFLRNISSQEQFMIALFSILFPLLIGVIFYKYSKNVIISFLVILVFRYFDFTLQGMRQAISIALIFYSFHFIVKRQIFKFIGVIFLATLFHSSAVFFSISYWIYSLKINKNFVKSSLAVVIIVFLLKDLLLSNFFYPLIQDTKYAIYTSENSEAQGYLYLILYVFTYITTLIFYPKIAEDKPVIQFYYKIVLIGITAQIFALNSVIIFRIALYFTIFFTLLLPEIWASIKDSYSKDELYFAMITVFVLIYILGGPAPGIVPYKFFW